MASRPRRSFTTSQVSQMLCNESDDEHTLSDMEVVVMMTTTTTAGLDLALFTIVIWKNHVLA